MAKFDYLFEELEVVFESAEFEKLNLINSRANKLLNLYVYYHYLGADQTKLDDLEEGNFNGRAPLGVRLDGLFLNIENDGEETHLDLIYAEYFRNEEEFFLDKTQTSIKRDLNSIKTVIDGLVKRNFSDFVELMNRFNSITDDNQPTYNVKFVTNIEISSKNKNRMKDLITSYKSLFRRTATFEMVFGDEIIQEIEEFQNPSKTVSSGELIVENPRNILYYGDEKSMITTVSATSLKELYQNYSKLGLFSSNLRYYVKIAKIDDAIQNTIKIDPELFWYKNNGIIIVCDEYQINQNELKLRNFSIVNGGQTTKLIGDMDFDEDFYITCKVIKNRFTSDLDKEAFALSIAEATNAQKPIKPRDLIANKKEQKNLKKALIEEGIYLQIKRGDKHNKKLFKENWQFVDNDELTQIIVASIFQNPSLAKNKTRLLTVDSIYNRLYPSDFSYDTKLIKDLLHIKLYQSEYLRYVKKNTNPKTEPFKISLVKYTKLILFSLIGLITKLYFNESLLQKVTTKTISKNELSFLIEQMDLNFGFLNHKNTNLVENFVELYEYLYKNAVSAGYIKFTEASGNIDPSVFAKNTSVYLDYILDSFIPIVIDDLNKKSKLVELIDNIFITKNKLTKEYTNSAFDDDYQPSLLEQLINYRTAIAKKKGLSEKQIFTNKVLNIIVNEKPSSLYDLENLKVFTPYQLNTYGVRIVEIVQEYNQRNYKKRY